MSVEALAYIYANEILRFHKRGMGRKKWRIVWSNRKVRGQYGHCDYWKREITIHWQPHTKHPNPLFHLRDTVLHEIAHALCPHEGHSNGWKWTLASIGGTPTSNRFLGKPTVIPSTANTPIA